MWKNQTEPPYLWRSWMLATLAAGPKCSPCAPCRRTVGRCSSSLRPAAKDPTLRKIILASRFGIQRENQSDRGHKPVPRLARNLPLLQTTRQRACFRQLYLKSAAVCLLALLEQTSRRAWCVEMCPGHGTKFVHNLARRYVLRTS